MLAPVLVVVMVTMVINVLKIFDIIINLGADTSEPGGQSSTLASDIYYKGFTDGHPHGPGQRARRRPVPAGDPGDAVQPQEDQGGRQMTTRARASDARHTQTGQAAPTRGGTTNDYGYHGPGDADKAVPTWRRYTGPGRALASPSPFSPLPRTC